MREQMAPPLLFWAPPSTAEKGISHPPGFKRSAPNQHPRLRAFSRCAAERASGRQPMRLYSRDPNSHTFCSPSALAWARTTTHP